MTHRHHIVVSLAHPFLHKSNLMLFNILSRSSFHSSFCMTLRRRLLYVSLRKSGDKSQGAVSSVCTLTCTRRATLEILEKQQAHRVAQTSKPVEIVLPRQFQTRKSWNAQFQYPCRLRRSVPYIPYLPRLRPLQVGWQSGPWCHRFPPVTLHPRHC